MEQKFHKVFKIEHVPSGKFLNRGMDGFLDRVGHIWPSRSGAKSTLGHVRKYIERNRRFYDDRNLDPEDPYWCSNVDDCRIIAYVLTPVVQFPED